jgi:hypothetical protein
MPFLILPVEDEPGPLSDRGLIERGSIALLSSGTDDKPSPTWLGRWANREVIRRSGLWNVDHIGEAPTKTLLDRMAYWIARV